MVKLKGAGHTGGPSHTTAELSTVEFDFQILKDETTARIGAIQGSVATVQDSVAALRAKLLEEIRLMRAEAQQPQLQTGSPQISFGTLPPVASTPISTSPASTAAASTASHTESMGSSPKPNSSNPPLTLGEHDVVLGFASEVYSKLINADGIVQTTGAKTRETVVLHSTMGDTAVNLNNAYSTQMPYFWNNNGGSQPFGQFVGPILKAFAGYSQAIGYVGQPSYGSAPTSHFSDTNPFTMKYSGPYSHSPINFISVAQPTQPFASPTYLNQSLPSHHQTLTGASGFHSHQPSMQAATNLGAQMFQPYYPTQLQPQPQYTLQQHQQPFDPQLPTMKQMRLEFGNFGGGDPVEWLNKAEQFFEFYKIPEDKKLAIATMHLTDKASDRWFMFKHEFPYTWQGLADLLMREFSGHNVIDYQAALARMSQTGSVEEYKEQFTKLSRRAPGFSQQVLLSCFLGGLKSEIRADVKAQKPRTLYEACELARIYEEKEASHKGLNKFNQGQRTFPTPNFGNQFKSITHGGSSNQAKPTTVVQHRPAVQTNNNVVGHRRLSQAEYQERRARNQCFFCDELFRPGHNCRKGQLMVIEVVQEEIELAGPTVNEVIEEHVQLDEGTIEPEVQLQVMGEQDNSDTMQVKGWFNKKVVHVLIDTGASHNFIHPSLLKKYKAQIVDIKPLKVRLASGALMQTKGQVSCEVVLGAAWLRTLGDITWNFETMKMQFHSNQVKYVLQGETKSQASVVSCKSMSRLLKKEKEAVLVQLSPVSVQGAKAAVHPEILKLVQQYTEIFQPPTTLPPAREHDHRIELLPNTTAINVRPYRYPHFQKSEIEKIVQEMLANGIIRPSVSPFSSPVILVKKKDGTWRMCVDYRSLNSATVKDKYPIPVVDELIDEVHGASIYTKLDLRSGYHQIRMCEADINKTAFRTHSGHYEFLVMPFGANKCPIHLSQNFLKVKESKCNFGVSQVEYLGHIISVEGVAVDPSKIDCIKKWEKPRTLKGLRGFLGLAGYYRKYVRNFGMIAKPLTDMLKKDNFKWSEESEKAFESLKQALISTPVLAIPDFNKEFVVECDASDKGIGVVLSQEGHPVAFLSKALAPRHTTLSVYDKEMMAVVYAVQHWRPYLLGHHFKIYTDHRTIEHFLKQRITTPAQQKWLLKLMGYDYSIFYKAGKNNAAPDALSRNLDLSTLTGVSQPIHKFVLDIQATCLSDPEAATIIQDLQQNRESRKHYAMRDSQLFL
ncbi:uncharacterized protein LOC133743955 [Rosa rugosa]|uniref:uncharacterized protein LOC133743955 n=1 Tax=Rosa rugosa TaxID=74645 RepID=UPI002B415721|nr:uncharacterized protein LOC133743955 [Rosa rugosa]